MYRMRFHWKKPLAIPSNPDRLRPVAKDEREKFTQVRSDRWSVPRGTAPTNLYCTISVAVPWLLSAPLVPVTVIV